MRINFKRFIERDFWSRAEISYQFVHFTLAEFIVYFFAYLTKYQFPIVMIAGLLTGLVVELNQWYSGSRKLEDSIRDIFFWALGGVVGFFI